MKMKHLACFFMAASTLLTLPRVDAQMPAASSDGYSSPLERPGYRLAWHDEFDQGTYPDTSNWTFDIGDGCPNLCGWGNAELQYYTDRPRNVYVKDGYLLLEAWEEPIGERNYSSCRIKTKGKRSFRYGRIDVRARLPVEQGIWPAIWMLGDEITEVGWPRCGEIDIMELVGKEPSRVYGTAHWDPTGNSHRYINNYYDLSAGTFADAFHVFSLVWTADELRWLVDDHEFHRLPMETFEPLNPFHGGFYLIMNIAVGGHWPGPPDETTVFPQQMVVDYVRYYVRD